MAKFIIAPHFRLQEWVAEEKNYFAAEGLDYEFRETMDSARSGGHQMGPRVGAYQSFEQGRTCDVSGACWSRRAGASGRGGGGARRLCRAGVRGWLWRVGWVVSGVFFLL